MPPCIATPPAAFHPTPFETRLCSNRAEHRATRAVAEPRLLSTRVSTHFTPAAGRSPLISSRTFVIAAALAACSAPEPSSAHSPAPAAGSTAVSTPAAVGAARDSTTVLGKADQGRIRGDSSAKLWLIMVSDFQCPYCRQWHDEVFATVIRDYVATGKVRIAYLNYPLSGHQNAMPAAEAAMCAAVQGKFWDMHDAIFRTQNQWAELANPAPVLDSLAASVGVAPGPYRSCIQSHATRPMILADQARATNAGVRATPTFFLGSQQIEGAVPLPEFRAALDKALATAP
jgi:protein-disulfide isomerase